MIETPASLKQKIIFLPALTGVCLQSYDVVIHAYVLMTNHIHLLMTPGTESGISRVMQLLGNRYVLYINRKYGKTGTFWEGRHKASLIDADQYLLICYRYIEMNPVRANRVEHPDDYRWSSYRSHATGSPAGFITNPRYSCE